MVRRGAGHAVRGEAWRYKQEYARALADLDEAIRLNPGDSFAYLTRGCVWDEKREFGKAIDDYGEAIRIDPEAATAHSNLAWLLATSSSDVHRDGRRAVELASRACDLTGWKVVRAIDTLAAAHAEVGDFEEALAMQEKANALYEDPEAREWGEGVLALYRQGKPYHEAD